MPDAATLAALFEIRADFSPHARREKRRLLQRAAKSIPRTLDGLRKYHDLLLFLAAYPVSAASLRRVESELRSVAAHVRTLPNARLRSPPLADSGIVGTSRHASFTPDLCRWLADRFGRLVELATDDGSAGDALDEFLSAFAANDERDGVLDERLTTLDWIRLARGRGYPTALAWLLDHLPRDGANADWVEQAFESLDLWVDWRLDAPPASRTWCRFPPRPIHFQNDGLIRHFALSDVLRSPLPHMRPRPRNEALRLIDICRAALAVRGRETDPVTYANPAETYLLRLDRGQDVAVFGMLAARRLPIESFFGYVAARNRVPMAYGGGWVFCDRCEIGVNIFDEFRGGESAYIFSQIMRVYHQLFGSRRFTVDPFQFGADNDEGLSSGAFWFYYRLGFRPVDAALAAQAAREAERVKQSPGYRTSRRTLRRLASARLEIDTGLNPRKLPAAPGLTAIGLAVTDWIARRFAGSRRRAIAWSTRRLGHLGVSQPPRSAAHAADAAPRLVLLAAMIEDLPRWPAADRRALGDVIAAKDSPSERTFAMQLATHERFHRHLARLAARGERIARRFAAR